jgi:hypothetical protein
MTTTHSTHTGAAPESPEPDHPSETPQPAARLRSGATSSHDGADGRPPAPNGTRVRMNLDVASRLLASSRWLQ